MNKARCCCYWLLPHCSAAAPALCLAALLALLLCLRPPAHMRAPATWSHLTCMPPPTHACLQVGGFLQRIDYVRKHAFAVLSILKDDQGQFPIRCGPAYFNPCS